jgi:hypothetical protein
MDASVGVLGDVSERMQVAGQLDELSPPLHPRRARTQ